ncbi:MAG TPA: T9SS type A sorting domain-containing protein [Draconibacterium sp.]|nr:T9SS type A sorting domain-containing protein [Draconibacterium sp.]
MKQIFNIVLISFSISPISAQEKQSIKMSDFIGINSNVASYDQKYLADLAKCAKWMREYHSWGHYEVADNYYKWDNITTFPQGYTWPDHNKFMDECKRLGINVLIDALDKPGWAGSARGAYSTGDGTKATDYLDKLEFMGQLVARYGAQKIDKSKLETADKVTGLNYVKYYEDDNEPDYWWETPQWPAEKYAVYCNAVHNGFGTETSADYPLLGIKSVDSTALHVLGGLAKNNTTYIQKILAASNGRVPFDVINIHTYCTDNQDGYSPENEIYGLEKNLSAFMDWCKKTLPEIPVWLTEFGWDTFLNGSNHSYVYAPAQQQANYIIRSYFVTLKMGFEKAFLFMDKDPDSKNTLQYNSSGIITDQAAGLQRKPSFYYLATLQNTLGDAVFNRVVSWRELIGNNEVFCFEFINESNGKVYALWTRAKNSKTDNGATLIYNFNMGYQPKYAYSIQPRDKDLDGEKTELSVTGSTIDLMLTETPRFLVISETKTALNDTPENEFEIRIFPNPASTQAQISIYNPKFQHVNISAYSSDGKLVEVISDQQSNSGKHNFTFGKNVNPGLYFISVNTPGVRKVGKVVIQ